MQIQTNTLITHYPPVCNYLDHGCGHPLDDGRGVEVTHACEVIAVNLGVELELFIFVCDEAAST